MTDKEIIKALKDKINGSDYQCFEDDDVLDLIVRQRAEIKRLNYILWGVMHSVDKWLDGAELEQDEVNRAATMREKTLRIVEKKRAEIERLKERIAEVNKTIKSEVIKEFANKLKKHSRKMQSSDFSGDFWEEAVDFSGDIWDEAVLVEDIDDLVKEMIGGKE